VNQLTLNRSVLLGVLHGKPISCVLMPGVQVTQGDYLLLPAVNDPLSGPTVMMMPAGQQGLGRAGWFIPSAEDEVAVAFNRWDSRSPVVLGGLWNGSDAPPESTYLSGTRTVPGRNSIRVAVGFAHLIEGLKSGPVPVKVK
jgi:hypothetical protein